MTARSEEQTAPLDEREIRLLRSKRLGLFFELMLIVDAAVVIGVVYASIATPIFWISGRWHAWFRLRFCCWP